MMRLLKFAVVGTLGFVVDVAVLYGMARLGTGWLIGRACSWLCAATFTWAVNRRFTFAVAKPPTAYEWAAFLAANSAGGLINYAIFAASLEFVPAVAAHPYVGVGLGSVAGMLVNFVLSARLVFTKARTWES